LSTVLYCIVVLMDIDNISTILYNFTIIQIYIILKYLKNDVYKQQYWITDRSTYTDVTGAYFRLYRK